MCCLDALTSDARFAIESFLIDCIDGSSFLTSIIECFGSSLMPIGG